MPVNLRHAMEALNENVLYKELLTRSAKIGNIDHATEIDLVARTRAGDRDAEDYLIAAHARFVMSRAVRYYTAEVELEDMFNVGLLGLKKGIDRYRLDSKNRLLSYAVSWIDQQIRSLNCETARTIRIPTNLATPARKMRAVIRAGEDLDLEKHKIKTASMAVMRDLAYVLMEPTSLELEIDEPEEGESRTLSDKVVIEPEDVLQMAEFEALRDMMTKTLTDRELFVFDMRFFHDWTLEEIAKPLGLSRERVRQIIASATDRIQDNYRRGEIRAARTRRLACAEVR
jgi:RNA polymerase sigma factor (sigma-70 family)